MDQDLCSLSPTDQDLQQREFSSKSFCLLLSFIVSIFEPTSFVDSLVLSEKYILFIFIYRESFLSFTLQTLVKF